MEAQLYRRDLPGAPTSPTFAPKHTYERRGEYEELEARGWEEACTVLFPVSACHLHLPSHYSSLTRPKKHASVGEDLRADMIEEEKARLYCARCFYETART
jgi:hypothetical protein